MRERTTIELVEGTSSSLPFPEASFDRVVSSLLFHHLTLLDGFATTADNVRGALPALVAAAGFDPVREMRRRRTALGTLTFLLARAGGAR